MRGSDQSASLYWLARMLEGGEDPLYVARRLVRFASEDIGECSGKDQTLVFRVWLFMYGSRGRGRSEVLTTLEPRNFLGPCGQVSRREDK